jgi:hypothetical protein
MELASFGGLGSRPGDLASDGDARVFISSPTEGLLEFSTDSNAVVRGAGHGVDIPLNTGVAIDSRGRVYAVEAADCEAGSGFAHVLDEDLAEVGQVGLGRCPPAKVFRITQDQQEPQRSHDPIEHHRRGVGGRDAALSARAGSGATARRNHGYLQSGGRLVRCQAARAGGRAR